MIYVQKMLSLKIETLSQDEEEFRILMKYMNEGRIAEGNDSSFYGRIKVNGIFKADEGLLRNEDENQLFNNLHNHW